MFAKWNVAVVILCAGSLLVAASVEAQKNSPTLQDRQRATQPGHEHRACHQRGRGELQKNSWIVRHLERTLQQRRFYRFGYKVEFRIPSHRGPCHVWERAGNRARMEASAESLKGWSHLRLISRRRHGCKVRLRRDERRTRNDSPRQISCLPLVNSKRREPDKSTSTAEKSVDRSHSRHFSLGRSLRPDREIFVTAGLTPVGRHRQPPPQKREAGIHIFGGDTLQIRIPTNRAVRMKRVAQRHKAGMKTRFALLAAPRIQSKYAKDIVRSVLSARTAGVLAFADWAIHLGDAGL